LERPADAADPAEPSEAAPAPADDAHAQAAPAEPSIATAPAAGGLPPSPVEDEPRQRASVRGATAGPDAPARAVHPVGGRGASQAAAVLAGAPLVATPAPTVGTGAPKASGAHLASGQEPAIRGAGSDHRPSTASSGSGGAALLGLVSALLFTVLLHWSRVRLPRVRWRATVFLALPERPG
jgi:hypothetical protein